MQARAFPFVRLKERNFMNLKSFEQEIGYSFSDTKLLRQALTHSSFANEKHLKSHSDNERLEFLGDAVLEVVSSDFLYHNYPNLPEGELTKLRASIVCEPTLALCAEPIHLGDYLFLGKGEDMTGGRLRKSIVSDALEAVIGAIYLDGGFANAKEFITRFILTDIESKQLFYDSKTILQEMVQAKHGAVAYRLTGETGPDHNKQFTVEVSVGSRILAVGCGHSKKAAEQEGAYKAILLLRKEQQEK